jgi:hypothetical protein
MEKLGPVDYQIVVFPGNEFQGEMQTRRLW